MATTQYSTPLKENLLDDSTSLSSSICSRRLMRKNDQTSASRKITPRRSNSKSQESLSISSFYTKMASSQNTLQASDNLRRNNIINQVDHQKNEKKRSPTPVPGVIKRRPENQKANNKRQIEIENDLLIADLQNKFTDEKQKNKLLEKKASHFEKQIKNKIKKIEDLEKCLTQTQNREKQLESKILEYKILIDKSESNLIDTRSKLEKFKNEIKANKYAEIQIENRKMYQQNEFLKTRISQLDQQNRNLSQRCKFFETDIFILKLQQNNQQKVPVFKDDHLESQIASRDEQNRKLEAKIAKLEIKLNYLNRKKNEEIQKCAQKKNQELNLVRNRLKTLSIQLKQTKKQNQKLLRRSSMPLPVYRSTIMTSQHWVTHQQIVSFSLSPQHFGN